MARQLSEQLEREVSAEELMKQTKSSSSKPAAVSNPATNSAPAAFDTAYTPNDTAYTPSMPPQAVAPPPPVAPPATTAPPGAYSPETAAAVHGADWHASPPENKTAND
jgi:hypothetical protein